MRKGLLILGVLLVTCLNGYGIGFEAGQIWTIEPMTIDLGNSQEAHVTGKVSIGENNDADITYKVAYVQNPTSNPGYILVELTGDGSFDIDGDNIEFILADPTVKSWIGKGGINNISEPIDLNGDGESGEVMNMLLDVLNKMTSMQFQNVKIRSTKQVGNTISGIFNDNTIVMQVNNI